MEPDMRSPSMLYALCAVVAMQKYFWLDQFAPPASLGTFYAMKNWHDVAELLALVCLDEFRQTAETRYMPQ